MEYLDRRTSSASPALVSYSRPSYALLQSAQDTGWLLLVLLTPLWVNLWGQQPFELPKAMLVRTLVWLLAGAALIEIVLSWQLDKPGKDAVRDRVLRANPILGPVGLLALVIGVTTATAVDWRLSLWGSYERSQGALTHLTYLLLFILAALQLRSEPRARLVVSAMAATGVPLILVGMAQGMGWNPVGLVSDTRSPMFATLGRANFLGAYLAILTPLTLALLLTTQRRDLQIVWSALLVAELIAIALTLARGAWLATALSLSIFVLLWWGWQWPRVVRRLAWAGVGLLFVSGPLAVLWLGRNDLGSIAARLSIWGATVKLIAQRPLLGFGSDALGIVFPRVYPPELVYFQGRDAYVDRAHNLLLDWAATGGIPALSAFLLLLFAFVLVVGRAAHGAHPPQKRVLLIAALAAVLGNTANNLVSFDVTATAMATWLLMGVGIALAAPPVTHIVMATAADGPRQASRRLGQWAVCGVIAASIGAAVWQFNARPLGADIAARAAYLHAQAGDVKNAILAAERAVAYWPVEPAHRFTLGQSYWAAAVRDPAAAPMRLAQAETELMQAVWLRPGDATGWLHAAQFYTSAARQFDSETQSLAADAYRQALALAPNHAVVYAAWGRISLEEGEVELAADLLRQAVALDASYGDAYLYLGAAEVALDRLEIALADYREAVRLLPNSSPAHAGLAHAYWLLDRPEEALAAVEKALQLDPQNAQAAALRGEIHGEIHRSR